MRLAGEIQAHLAIQEQYARFRQHPLVRALPPGARPRAFAAYGVITAAAARPVRATAAAIGEAVFRLPRGR